MLFFCVLLYILTISNFLYTHCSSTHTWQIILCKWQKLLLQITHAHRQTHTPALGRDDTGSGLGGWGWGGGGGDGDTFSATCSQWLHKSSLTLWKLNMDDKKQLWLVPQSECTMKDLKAPASNLCRVYLVAAFKIPQHHGWQHSYLMKTSSGWAVYLGEGKIVKKKMDHILTPLYWNKSAQMVII